MKKDSCSKSNKVLFFLGVAAILIGTVTLSFLCGRKLLRDYRRNQLMKNNVVIEIPEIRIKAPVLEGTNNDVLSKAAGHFPDTGALGKGNYCIAAHSSTIYKEYFNALRDVKIGMKVKLYDVSKNLYTYYVTDTFIVEPNETWVLDNTEDVRVTLVTCTDDGKQRRIVVAKPQKTNV
ncbi:MAG: class D sortase [Ruminococcus sp.]|uniref:class D sortase n=1 Tax=Ruminococcus sp. TaxID=41978 RepID=UPI0025D2BD6E|nr:class D sortase [Ruminococcus sp.]MCR4796426.1 class D sortase [Ruminococcus sp.]